MIGVSRAAIQTSLLASSISAECRIEELIKDCLQDPTNVKKLLTLGKAFGENPEIASKNYLNFTKPLVEKNLVEQQHIEIFASYLGNFFRQANNNYTEYQNLVALPYTFGWSPDPCDDNLKNIVDLAKTTTIVPNKIVEDFINWVESGFNKKYVQTNSYLFPSLIVPSNASLKFLEETMIGLLYADFHTHLTAVYPCDFEKYKRRSNTILSGIAVPTRFSKNDHQISLPFMVGIFQVGTLSHDSLYNYDFSTDKSAFEFAFHDIQHAENLNYGGGDLLRRKLNESRFDPLVYGAMMLINANIGAGIAARAIDAEKKLVPSQYSRIERANFQLFHERSHLPLFLDEFLEKIEIGMEQYSEENLAKTNIRSFMQKAVDIKAYYSELRDPLAHKHLLQEVNNFYYIVTGSGKLEFLPR